MEFRGVMTAITTPFNDDLTVDHDFLAKHANWLVDHGCTGIVPLGSLGEGNTLQFDEKLAIVETCVAALDGRAPVMPGISALSTAEAVRIARGSAERGAEALMVLPPYVHNGKMHETRGHCRGHLRGHRPAVHALQQPLRLRGRHPARDHGRTGRRARQPAGDQGVERRHPADHRGQGPAGRPPRRLRRPRRHALRSRVVGGDGLDRGSGQRAAGRVRAPVRPGHGGSAPGGLRNSTPGSFPSCAWTPCRSSSS